ncbi:SymE family type I addiction module toxin [Eisenbergiella porci]|uniref:SymE family type I addiction module toxin n=1 Tax=Eisenbergiella porci TaxID=2652274 RepID=UPI002A816BB9|nr:SymE family type I addiction module toxin [Eisenbergiella porci]
MATKNTRELKVRAQSGYQYKETPTIILKGEWLKEIGFDIGDYITVSCENGKLVITPDIARAEMKAAERAFMEVETKKLRARFEKEREKIHAQYVTERTDRYKA